MLPPLEIHADFEANAFEIRYRHLKRGTLIDHDERVAASISVGVDQCGNIVAIELLSLEPSVLADARAYANSKGLAFPRDLAGLLATA